MNDVVLLSNDRIRFFVVPKLRRLLREVHFLVAHLNNETHRVYLKG